MEQYWTLDNQGRFQRQQDKGGAREVGKNGMRLLSIFYRMQFISGMKWIATGHDE